MAKTRLIIDGETFEGAGVRVLALGKRKLEGPQGAVAMTDRVTLDAEGTDFWAEGSPRSSGG